MKGYFGMITTFSAQAVTASYSKNTLVLLTVTIVRHGTVDRKHRGGYYNPGNV